MRWLGDEAGEVVVEGAWLGFPNPNLLAADEVVEPPSPGEPVRWLPSSDWGELLVELG